MLYCWDLLWPPFLPALNRPLPGTEAPGRGHNKSQRACDRPAARRTALIPHVHVQADVIIRYMLKALPISFPVKSAEQLASHLGVSKSRKDRIFTIVAKAAGKNGSHASWRHKTKSNRQASAKKYGFQIST